MSLGSCFGSLFERLGCFLGASGILLRPLGGFWGTSWMRFGRLLGPSGCLLGPSWSALGKLYGRSWSHLGGERRPPDPGGHQMSGRALRLSTSLFNPTSPLGVGGLELLLFHLPLFPFGEGFTPPPTPSPGPGRGGPRGVGASKMAQDGSKRASESPRWPRRWLKIAQDRSRWLPRCSKRPQDCPKTAPRGLRASEGGHPRSQNPSKT